MSDTTDYSIEEQRFADEVKKLRLSRGWSQSEMADRLTDAGLAHINGMTVSRLEKLQRPVRMVEAEAYSRVFGRTVWNLAHPEQIDEYIASIEEWLRDAQAAWGGVRRALTKYAQLMDGGEEVTLEVLASADALKDDHQRATELRLQERRMRHYLDLDPNEVLQHLKKEAEEKHGEHPTEA